MKLNDVKFKFTQDDMTFSHVILRAEVSTILDLLTKDLSEDDRAKAERLRKNHIATYLLAQIDLPEGRSLSPEELSSLRAEILER